jgi:CRISPR-associated exonuclease Cas4
MIWIALISIAALLLSLALKYRAISQAAELGFSGAIIFGTADHGQIFISDTYGLVGTPDYVLDEAGAYVPIERKSRQLSEARPYESEILQLAAYCLLVEERFGKAVRVGRLQYPNQSVDIAFDDQLRERLLSSLDAVKAADLLPDVPRSHNSPARCRGCGFRRVCTDSLAR